MIKTRIAWNKGLTGEEYKKHYKNSFSGTFKEGHMPWNTGKKGIHLCIKAEWKKGDIPWNKGLKTGSLSEETKKKLSKIHKGHLVSKETREKLSKANKGQIPWCKGKHFTEEHKIKLSENNAHYWLGKHPSEEARNKMSLAAKGEKHYNWQGGISKEPYPFNFNKELKELIRGRDNYQCQLCGMPECENIKKLSIHHIDYNKKNLNPNNLISLCSKCHTKTNFKRKYWTEYFSK